MNEKLKEFVWDWTFGNNPAKFETDTYAEKLKIESNLDFAQAVADFTEKRVLEELPDSIRHQQRKINKVMLTGVVWECYPDCPRCYIDQRLAKLKGEKDGKD